MFQGRSDVTSPILEDEPPTPANVYGTTKAAAELLTRMYRAEYGLSALEDQQLGGLIMWVPGGLAYLIAALMLCAGWLARPVRAAGGSRS